MRNLLSILMIISTFGLFGQATGGYDLSFGNNGMVVHDLYGNTDGINAMELLPSGKILTAGFGYDGTLNQLYITRYNEDGSIDQSFDQNDIEQAIPAGYGAVAEDLAILPSGEVLVSGCISDGYDSRVFVARVNSLGNKDAGFGMGGVLFLGESGYDYEGSELSMLADGYFILSATADNGIEKGIFTWSFTADGTPNRAFGNDGVKASWVSGNDLILGGIVYQNANAILIAGTRVDQNGQNGFVQMLNANGSLNTTFAMNGVLNITETGADIVINDVAVSQSGNIFLTGYSETSGVRDVLSVKLTASGAFDSGFGMNGIIKVSAGAGIASGVKIKTLSDERVLIGGNLYNGMNNDMLVIYLDAFGQLDYNFSNDGIQEVSLYSGHDRLNDIACDESGRVFISGNTDAGSTGFDLAMVSMMGISTTTGITELTSSELGVTVSAGRMQCQIPEEGTLIVTDMSGRLVAQHAVYSNTIQEIEITNSGVYIVELASGTERYSAKVYVH